MAFSCIVQESARITMYEDFERWQEDEPDSDYPHEETLTEDDLAVLRAFEEMDDSRLPSSATGANEISSPAEGENDDDILTIFVSEVVEDLAKVQHALTHLLAHPADLSGWNAIKRAAHKIRGTSGAVGFTHLSAIGDQTELLAERVLKGEIVGAEALGVLDTAAGALARTVEEIMDAGQEPEAPLHKLLARLEELNIRGEPAPEAAHSSEARSDMTQLPQPEKRFWDERLGQLIAQADRVVDLHSALENAQLQVQSALQDLQAARTRLRRLEPSLSTLLFNEIPLHPAQELSASSSLINRILQMKQMRQNRAPETTESKQQVPLEKLETWDTLDIERYTDKDLLFRSLSEAIMDVSVATARVQTAYARLQQILQEYMQQSEQAQQSVHQLRLTPLRVLFDRLATIVGLYPVLQNRVHLDLQGETLEVDYEILMALFEPLVHLMHTCLAGVLEDDLTVSEKEHSIRLHASTHNGEIRLEIGFSMSVHGGALEHVQPAIQSLHGSITLSRNDIGGISFQVRVPVLRGKQRCLLLRAGDQHMVVSLAQIQRVSDGKGEALDRTYYLNDLLALPAATEAEKRVPTVLILEQVGGSHMRVGVEVDEVVGILHVMMKRLPPYLQRPGISATAEDGKGSVLLHLDLSKLIASSVSMRRNGGEPHASVRQPLRQPTVLIADDSVSQRQTFLQALKREGFVVLEASDGLEALQQLLEHIPDVFLLDIEMPNLNGYDVLNTMQLYPELAEVKIVMLTSRSSEKHKKRARELGAHAYLTKPVALDDLLTTVRRYLSLPV
uniref:histidine kinase n=1 Tax=Thermosporothrix sp. COM3 TaxID=2490863 RepID=A0A455SRW9_9CHLR|nr:hypothetical protein KTC_45500 [Thermosporothrix sp. COM3]